MNEIEVKKKDELGETEDQDFKLLDEVENLKKNSVSKEEYEKLKSKNKELMKRIVEGGGQEEKSEDTPDLDKIREALFVKNAEGLSKRDFWINVLTLRHERLKNEGVDIFLPKGQKTRYNRSDIESANKVDEVISDLIDQTEDNPAYFDILFEQALN